MINKKYFGLAILTSVYFVLIFFLDLYFYNFENNYFWCVSANFFENIDRYLPVHCDEGPYLQASQNLEYFFSENNPYQKRPLYVFSIFLSRNIARIITFGMLSNYMEFKIGMIFVQYVILFLISVNSIKFLKIEKLNLNNSLLIFLVFSIPNIRWNLFFPSHGNITLLLLLFSLNKLVDETFFTSKNFIYYLFLGFAAMFHRTAIVFGILLILIRLYKNTTNYRSSILGFLYLLIPSFLYEAFFLISDYKSFDWNREIYGQFYWLLDAFLGRKVIYHDSTCQQLNIFLKCNFQVTKYFILYFVIGIIYLLVYLLKNRWVFKDENYFFLIILSLFTYVFWSLQGLYPNFRFINYSIGYFLFLSLIYISSKNGPNIILNISILLYEVSILYMEPYSITYFNPNYLTYISILFFIVSLLPFKMNKVGVLDE